MDFARLNHVEWRFSLPNLSKKQFELHIVSIRVEHEQSSLDGFSFQPNEITKLSLLFERVNDLVEKKQLFLQKELRIKQVSQLLGTNDKYVSLAIQQSTGLMFSQYVGLFRVGLAVKFLTCEHQASTMEEIAEASGFSSKAAFYRNFKEVVGMAPMEFVRACRSGDETLGLTITKIAKTPNLGA